MIKHFSAHSALLLSLSLLIVAASQTSAQIAVPVNLYVADLTYSGGTVHIGSPRKLTGDRGISSQPAFSPDGKAIFYVSRRDSANSQSDVYRIDLKTGNETRITATSEMENSPTVTPDGQLMVIRWTPPTLFREWGPWIYDMKGNPLRGVLPGPDTVGYYVRIDPNRFAMVRPKSRTTVAIFDTRDKSMKDVDLPVANLPPQLIPGQKAISYTRPDSVGRNTIRRLDLRSMDTSTIAPALTGRIAHAWTPRGFVLMGKGNNVFALRPGAESTWRRVATFRDPELQSVTTYVVSPAGDKLILISPVKPALHTALRDSLQSGVTLGDAVKGYVVRSPEKLRAEFDLSEGGLIGLAMEQLRKDHGADAAKLLEMTASVFPNSYGAYLILGDAYTKVDDKTRATKAYSRSLELNPQTTDDEKKDAERARAAMGNK
jgi:TolB protein